MPIEKFRRLRRAEASQYLLEIWGISRTPGTLAKLAVIGGGPRFEHANRIPLYSSSELDAWASSLISPLKLSTSDPGESLPKSETDPATEVE